MNFSKMSISDPSSWVPTYGNYCGPGWSSGSRTDQPDFSVAPITDANGLPSQVDTACKVHDQSYFNAAGLPDEAMQVLNADIALLRSIASMDWSAMSGEEQVYTVLMGLAFAEKIGGWIWPQPQWKN